MHREKIYFVFLFVITIFSNNCLGQETLFVKAPSGLNLREQASINSGIIALLDFGTVVTVKKRTKVFSTLNDDGNMVDGQWLSVTGYNKKQGYFKGFLFDGFLTDDKNLVMDYDSIFTSEEFTGFTLKNIFELTKKLNVKAGPLKEVKETTTYEFGDIEFSVRNSITFEACSAHDATIIFRNLGGFFLIKSTIDWTGSQKINETEEQLEFENIKSHFWEDRISLIKNKNTGQIVRISRYTRGEGGGVERSITRNSKYKWTYSSSALAD